ncbi:MAG: DUF4397 domain-containing protein [Gemmatimonadaceae bacterium]|nr:DUF4397 domain-containing protein [Gemmatimonadaceae bacterium]
MRAVHTTRRRTRLHARRHARLLVPIALLSLTAACDDSDAPDAVASIRFLHASQGRAAVDFRADGTTEDGGRSYGAAWSNSVVLEAGARTLSARLAGATTDIASTAASLVNSASYSAILAKRPTGDSLLVLADTAATPADTKAFVRILNVAPTAASVDVYITAANADLATTTPNATAIDFLKRSPYLEVTAAAQRVRLTTAGTKSVVLDVNTLALPNRSVRSIAVLEATAGGAPLQGIVSAERN